MADKTPAREFRPNCEGISHWWGEMRERFLSNGDRLEIHRCVECGVAMIQTFSPRGGLCGTRWMEPPGT